MHIRSQKQVSFHQDKKLKRKTLANEQLSMAPASIKRIASHWKQYLCWIMLPMFLAGCAQKSLTETANIEPETPVVKQKTIDYRWAECKTLAAFYHEGLNNPLFWLRTIECTQRIMSTEAQRQASSVIVAGWDGAFYKSILLERAGMTVAERRAQLVLLESYQLQFPSSMRVLLSTWIENQTLTLALADEKNRNRRFVTETENKMDLLKKQNNALEHELNTTRKKLESLTQIERQLSSRKQGASVDAISQEEALSDVQSSDASNAEKPADKPIAEQSNKSTASEQSITKENNEVSQPSVSAVKPEPPKAEQVKPDAKNTSTEKENSATVKPTETGSK